MHPFFELALAVKAGQRELEQRVAEAMRPLGVTAAQADALVVIGAAGPLSLKELGDLLIAESGHPSRLVDRLVAAGWVDRSPAPDDRRRAVLSLTAAGRRVERRVQRVRRDLLAVADAVVAERDLRPALDLLSDLLRASAYAELLARRRELGV